MAWKQKNSSLDLGPFNVKKKLKDIQKLIKVVCHIFIIRKNYTKVRAKIELADVKSMQILKIVI